MAKRVLVVDDEKAIVKGINFSLLQEGMQVDSAYDGEEALEKARTNSYDIIVLDVMLPKMDGFEVCRSIREFSDVPIIMLTAKGEDMDKIIGLDNGADDYMTKPFNILELKARIKAIMRRSSSQAAPAPSSVIVSGDFEIDTDSLTLKVAGKPVNLSHKEFELIVYLVKNAGKVFSRDRLLQEIWGSEGRDARAVDVHIRRIREKIEPNPSEPRYIQTKWGSGYFYAK